MQTRLVNKFLLPAALVIAVVTLSAVVYQLSGTSSTENGQTDSASCDLNAGPCTANINDREISLSLQPTPVKSLTPLQFTAEITGEQPDSVWLDIQGDEMYMGLNQPAMRLEHGRWSTETELAVCTTGKMRWRATLVINEGDKQTQTSFFFEAE